MGAVDAAPSESATGSGRAPGPLRAGASSAAMQREVRRHLTGLAPGARLVVALSGGPDSAGLLTLVRAARPDVVTLAVHVRHRLRDDVADAVAARRAARALGVACRVVHAVVTAAGEGPEAAARRARYRALAAEARAAGAIAVATGHTADDQAETVLLALGRGAGARGLAAMRPARALATAPGEVLLLRPLLGVRRVDVRRAGATLPSLTDPTNADSHLRRVRVREEALPALARLSGGRGDPVALLGRTADLLRDDAELLDALADDAAARLVTRYGPASVIAVEPLRSLHPALARRVVRRLLGAARAGLEGLDAASVTRVLELADGGATEAAGQVAVSAGGGWLAAVGRGCRSLGTRPVSPSEGCELPDLGLVLATRGEGHPDALVPVRARPPSRAGGAGALVALPPDGLEVRARRPGDRVPGHRRTLGDRMTDLGVPRVLRDLVPVVAVTGGPPVWVPGVAAPLPPGPGEVALHLALRRRPDAAG